MPDAHRSALALALTLLAALVGLGLRGAAHGDTVSTGFEFFDTDGSITLGDPGAEVAFTGGEARTVARGSLYHRGFFSWLVGPGEVGEVTFDLPAAEVSMFVKRASTAGELRVYDTAGALVRAQALTTFFEEVRETETPGGTAIDRIELANTGTGDLIALDTFAYCPSCPFALREAVGAGPLALPDALACLRAVAGLP